MHLTKMYYMHVRNSQTLKIEYCYNGVFHKYLYHNLIITMANSSPDSDNILVFFSLNPHKDTELDSIYL